MPVYFTPLLSPFSLLLHCYHGFLQVLISFPHLHSLHVHYLSHIGLPLLWCTLSHATQYTPTACHRASPDRPNPTSHRPPDYTGGPGAAAPSHSSHPSDSGAAAPSRAGAPGPAPTGPGCEPTNHPRPKWQALSTRPSAPAQMPN